MKTMGLTKKYLKSKPVCKVTFHLPKEAAADAKKVVLVGDFNDWNIKEATPLKALKKGGFKATIDLEKDKEYQFRYLIDDEKWENDWDADKYVPSGVGNEENSVVVV